MKRTAIFAILCAMSTSSWGYCSEPTPPDAPGSYDRPTKPTVPYCVNTYNNTHTCEDWEIENYQNQLRHYQSEIDDYVRKLEDYTSEAETYYKEVVSYARCEVRDLS
jgi:hypothetical protein